MKKKVTIWATVLTILGSGSVMWMPDAVAEFRNYMTAPSIVAQEKMESRLVNTMMAMKYFDIRTYEVTKYVSDMQKLIELAEEELIEEIDMVRKERIKQRLEHYKGIQEDHKEKLEGATEKDQQLLAKLSEFVH